MNCEMRKELVFVVAVLYFENECAAEWVESGDGL